MKRKELGETRAVRGAREKIKRAGGTPALLKATAQGCGNFLLRVGVGACGVRHYWDVVVAEEGVRAAVDKF